MLHILWVILKIIGIVLLVLIGVILVLLVLLLFLPIQYSVKGEVGENTYAKGSVSWLFQLVAVSFRYEMKQFRVFLRILGIPFKIPLSQEEKTTSNKKKSAKMKRSKEKKIFKKNRKKSKSLELLTNESGTPIKVDTTLEEVSGFENNAEISDSNDSSTTKIDKSLKNFNEEKKQSGRSERNNKDKRKKDKKSFFNIIKEKIKKLKYTVKHICDRIIEIIKTVGNYKKLWEDEKIQLAIEKLKTQLIYFLKHLKPKKFKLYLHYGLDDPAVTGQILGGISMIYPFFHKNVSVIPDFDQEILEGRLVIKGRIQIFILVKIFIRLYWDKNIKYALESLKK